MALIRVSTPSQARNGFSPRDQRRAIVDAIDVRAQLRITASGRRYLIVSSLIAPAKRYALG